jgi:hypothetical protein
LVFQKRVRFTPEDIPDGTGQTIFWAEKYAACSWWALTSGPQAPSYVAAPDTGFQVRPAECDPALPQTPHAEGIQVGMGDGSVRLVGRGVSPGTWFAAHTPAGGETLGRGEHTDWLP